MPGLIGIANVSPGAGRDANAARAALDAMRAAITHRDWLVADEPFCDDRVWATRVDTRLFQPGAQPHAETDVFVWLDGEIYDDRNSGMDDPALLAARYRDDPEFSFLRDVDGFFTAVLYDRGRNKVHLISDRYGFRHLYWAEFGGRLWWGTEQKAVFQVPGFTPRVDARAAEEFLSRGYIRGDRSWLEGVELVPSGSVLTWDLTDGARTVRRYWEWPNARAATVPRDRRELVEEWGRLFVEAVRRRCSGRVGVLLSGGLDSRAILAAVPDAVGPLHAVTFGRADSTDVRIAARAAGMRGAVHHVQELNERNWLAPRFEAVWWSEGQTNLIDIHGVGGYDERRGWFDVNLSGFLGDVTMGGSYLRKGEDEIEGISNRGRRFIAMGLKMQTSYFENRLPFFDNDLLEFTLSIPRELRARDHVYADMLLYRFPRYFRGIPWQDTGVPITWPLPLANLFRRGQGALHKLGLGPGRRSYGDYNAWLRREPARSQIGAILTDKNALYAEYVPRDAVVESWNRLLGGAPESRAVGRYATFEIWLQQAFNGRYRSAPSTSTT